MLKFFQLKLVKFTFKKNEQNKKQKKSVSTLCHY